MFRYIFKGLLLTNPERYEIKIFYNLYGVVKTDFCCQDDLLTQSRLQKNLA